MAQAISPRLKVDCTRAPVQCNENRLLKNPSKKRIYKSCLNISVARSIKIRLIIKSKQPKKFKKRWLERKHIIKNSYS